MSIPSTFTVFAPNITLYKTITAAEYLRYTKVALATLTKWQGFMETSFSAASIFSVMALAVNTATEDATRVGKPKDALLLLCNSIALLIVTYSMISGSALLVSKYIAIPALQGRVAWLESGV